MLPFLASSDRTWIARFADARSASVDEKTESRISTWSLTSRTRSWWASWDNRDTILRSSSKSSSSFRLRLLLAELVGCSWCFWFPMWDRCDERKRGRESERRVCLSSVGEGILGKQCHFIYFRCFIWNELYVGLVPGGWNLTPRRCKKFENFWLSCAPAHKIKRVKWNRIQRSPLPAVPRFNVSISRWK